MQIISRSESLRVKSSVSRMGMIRGAILAAQISLIVVGLAMTAAAQDNASVMPLQLRGVGIDQRLNNQVPLNLKFRDEAGQTVTLGSYFGKKPVILSLVYYTCPMLCTMAENGLLNALRDVKFDIGEQYEVVTVSIDPTETPGMAMGKKAVYVGLYGRPAAKQGWHFLVGDDPDIRALSQAVGFLMLDNGITATAFLITGGVPLIVELGASLDVLFAVFVLGLLTGHMRRAFGGTDLDQLRELRD